MRILLTIHEELSPDSGAAGSTFRIGQEYEKLGHTVTFFSFGNLPAWMPLALKDVFFPEFLAAHLMTSLRHETIDVVDASTGDAWLWAKFFRRNRDKRPLLVTRSHYLEHIGHLQCLEEQQLGNLEISWKYPLYRGSIALWEVYQSMAVADLMFVLNQYEKEFSAENFRVALDRIHVVPNGISDVFLDLPYVPLTQAIVPLSIAVVGTYILRKGIRYSVPALQKVMARYPDVSVSFLGTECPAANVYNDFPADLHSRLHVIPHYEQAHLPALLEEHYVSLLASNYEAFGKVLIETMACGLAPVATATPGPQEVLTHEQNGLLVPVRDAEGIEAALVRLLSNRDLLEQMRSQAYQAAQGYSWTTTAKDRLAQYEKYLSV